VTFVIETDHDSDDEAIGHSDDEPVRKRGKGAVGKSRKKAVTISDPREFETSIERMDWTEQSGRRLGRLTFDTEAGDITLAKTRLGRVTPDSGAARLLARLMEAGGESVSRTAAQDAIGGDATGAVSDLEHILENGPVRVTADDNVYRLEIEGSLLREGLELVTASRTLIVPGKRPVSLTKGPGTLLAQLMDGSPGFWRTDPMKPDAFQCCIEPASKPLEPAGLMVVALTTYRLARWVSPLFAAGISVDIRR
jgi:hypothetical protein